MKRKRNRISFTKNTLMHVENSLKAMRESEQGLSDTQEQYERFYALKSVHDRTRIHSENGKKAKQLEVRLKKAGIQKGRHFWTLQPLRFGDELTYRVVMGEIFTVATGGLQGSPEVTVSAYTYEPDQGGDAMMFIPAERILRDLNSPAMENGVFLADPFFTSYRRAKSAAKLANQLHVC